MRQILMMTGLFCGSISTLAAQNSPIEIPLRVEAGRLMVSLDAPGGKQFDFVLSLGMSMFTEAGAAAIGDTKNSLRLGGTPFQAEGIATVADSVLAIGSSVPAGMVGSTTLNAFDILIDVPGGRLVLKPVGRFVDWPSVSLSNPVPLRVFHGALASLDVELDGEIYGALLDFQSPDLVVNESVKIKSKLVGETVHSYRMGYVAYSDVPFQVRDLPLFQGWDPDGNGFVVIGAVIAYDCAIAISFAHSEMRTCRR